MRAPFSDQVRAPRPFVGHKTAMWGPISGQVRAPWPSGGHVVPRFPVRAALTPNPLSRRSRREPFSGGGGESIEGKLLEKSGLGREEFEDGVLVAGEGFVAVIVIVADGFWRGDLVVGGVLR